MKEDTEQPEHNPVVYSGYEQTLEWEARKVFFSNRLIPKQATTANVAHGSSISNLALNGAEQEDAPSADSLVGENNSGHWSHPHLPPASVLQVVKRMHPERTPGSFSNYEQTLDWEAREVFLPDKFMSKTATAGNIAEGSSISNLAVNGAEQKDALSADSLVGGNNSGHWSHPHLPPASVLQVVKRMLPERTPGSFSNYEQTLDWEDREVFLPNKFMSKTATAGNVAHGSSISNLAVNGAEQKDAFSADSLVGGNNSGYWSHPHLPPTSVLQVVKRMHPERTPGSFSNSEQTVDWEARDVFSPNKLMSKTATAGNVAHGSSISNLAVNGAEQKDAPSADGFVGGNN